MRRTAMLLVPRQLQRHGMTGAVPYYGGRLTPAHIYGIENSVRRGSPPPPARPAPPMTVAPPGAPAPPDDSAPPPPAAATGSSAEPEDPASRARLPDLPARHRRDQPPRVRRFLLQGRLVMGPVQVLVVGFDHPTFSGEVLAEFERLRGAGVVRLVDLLLVA